MVSKTEQASGNANIAIRMLTHWLATHGASMGKEKIRFVKSN
jgi:hypothetical protein